jgi:hypothetical protein
MLRPKKEFENSTISFRVGSNTFTIKVGDITAELVDKMKHYTDLSYFVEKHEPQKVTKYDPELHDVETVMQKALNEEPKKKRTRKKKNI